MLISNFLSVYSSMKRDVQQSELKFWKENVLPKMELNQTNMDVLQLSSKMAERENQPLIVKMIKEFLEANSGRS